jgi:hypothetical protein
MFLNIFGYNSALFIFGMSGWTSLFTFLGFDLKYNNKIITHMINDIDTDTAIMIVELLELFTVRGVDKVGGIIDKERGIVGIDGISLYTYETLVYTVLSNINCFWIVMRTSELLITV